MKLHRLFFCLVLLLVTTSLFAGGAAAEEKAAETVKTEKTAEAVQRPDALYWAIAITMAAGSLSAGLAVGKVGSAALGAAAEKPELLGKAIAFVGLGEGIALFGFLISLFLYLKI